MTNEAGVSGKFGCPGRPKLSPRETQVLALLRAGLTYRAIGERLNISEKTVSTYATTLRSKFRVRSRAELTALTSKEIPL